ncbi:hypothetical protein BABINDRAFT_160618 [Babjeviella inositovora NRRL Y-12698]|uniref:Uncharacterized protein n=1 Tax=Babjeviella inositovora NRRL Y-12698 TaxID=984486 RepID=A0A1E3QU88_9ASCO|nr:uncharacterized protein BABINDRAFT_160618 [Babjeviella inositovora NRRL Y-12698]ODQ81239.1 hypothetical protein BABINDRAFT_160618 [Babjeviella inositovora NRRL Y-12698]
MSSGIYGIAPDINRGEYDLVLMDAEVLENETLSISDTESRQGHDKTPWWNSIFVKIACGLVLETVLAGLMYFFANDQLREYSVLTSWTRYWSKLITFGLIWCMSIFLRRKSSSKVLVITYTLILGVFLLIETFTMISIYMG